jgi:dihydropteroate synthase
MAKLNTYGTLRHQEGDMDHDISMLAQLGNGARVYLRPTGFVDGPYDAPGNAVNLAGGLCWFAQVHIIARTGVRRNLSCVVPVADMPRLAEQYPALAAPWEALTRPRAPLVLGKTTVRLDRPHLMGVLNITPDSFSDGGAYVDASTAVMHASAMISAGATLIDVGAESTRPGAKPVSVTEEMARLEPVLAPLCALGSPVSLDTRQAAVMHYGLQQGAALINDVSALQYDAEGLAQVVQAGCPVVLMHMQGEPGSMLNNPSYDDVLLDVYDMLEARIEACVAAGVARERIIIDPGIGFGKNLRHNLDLMGGLSLFHALGVPVLLGVSRKRLIGALSKEEAPEDRLAGSLALAQTGLAQGVQLLRVHDVAATMQLLNVWRGLRDGAMAPPAWLSE